jgi:hypothetical protein
VPNGYYHLDRMLTGAVAKATLNRTGAVPVEKSTRPGAGYFYREPGPEEAHTAGG